MVYLKRADGRIEFVCKHGVGHTIDAPKEYKKKLGKYWNMHGCDSCCSKKKHLKEVSVKFYKK